jgi:hypothetical protein
MSRTKQRQLSALENADDGREKEDNRQADARSAGQQPVAQPSSHGRCRWRYKVVRPTPTTSAICWIVFVLESYSCWATASLSGVSDRGRPPLRPRARAAARPDMVLSRTKLASNSASDAITPAAGTCLSRCLWGSLIGQGESIIDAATMVHVGGFGNKPVKEEVLRRR